MLSADGLCLTAGVVTSLVAFLGCWRGLVPEPVHASHLLCPRRSSSILLEFAAGTLGFVYPATYWPVTQWRRWKVGIQLKYNPDNYNGLAEVWDHIHSKFQCCGVRSVPGLAPDLSVAGAGVGAPVVLPGRVC
uniref:Putative tetraspanin-9 n=1 Tax=Ixodes ricinus TaxID=34613 RepID=V5GLN5_IXORI